MIRATTGGVLRGYRSNLMKSFIAQNKARETVLTQRNFNSYAEDPAAASKAFQLRKARMSVESQYNICDDTYRKFQTAFSSLDSIDKLIDTENGSCMKTLSGTTLTMLNDPTGDARTQLGKALDQMSETIVQSLNQKYGENFIFAGADGQNVPFTIEDNKLYYRGVPVDAAVPDVVTNFGTTTKAETATGKYVPSSAKTLSQDEYDALDAADQAKYTRFDYGAADGNKTAYVLDSDAISKADYDTAVSDAEKLNYLVNEEKYFVDIGLGFKENINHQLIESSGFNAALHGLTFVGYGVDEEGDPKNIYSLVQKLKDLAARVDNGKWSDDDGEEFTRLVRKLEKASSDYKTEFTNMAAGTTKLENNLQLLKDNYYNLQEQYSALEDADMVESISNFVWAQYCYNAALKVGNSILSESLMDYLN